jgi:hypothetical protein
MQESSWIFARHVFAKGLTVFEAGEVYQQESWMKRQLILLWTHASVATPCESNFLVLPALQASLASLVQHTGRPKFLRRQDHERSSDTYTNMCIF